MSEPQVSVVDMFTKGGTDYKGRTLQDFNNYSDSRFEFEHDFIQWMFPLHEKSFHAQVSPVLSKEDIETLRASNEAKLNMTECLTRFCRFLGLIPNDTYKQKQWLHDGNHNMLRITRVIRSLRLFGLNNLAEHFYNAVVRLAKENGISTKTLDYWKSAMYDDVMSSMTKRFLGEKRMDIR